MSASNHYNRSQRGESSSKHASEDFNNSTGYDDISIRAPRSSTKATKRSRGEIACAECRRLKVRCDRTVPCSTCVKRGCGALCPNGTIPPGEGSRFVLAASDHLQQKLVRMEARMRSLEDALAIIQGSTSDRPHPLLVSPEQEEEEKEEETAPSNPVADNPFSETSALADALGSLFIEGHGASRFFGPSGGSESLLLKAKEMEALSPSTATRRHLQELDPSYLPPEIIYLCQTFPLTPPGIQSAQVQPMIEAFLPPVTRAITLCDTFLEHLSWMFHIVSRQQVVKELIPAVYKQTTTSYGPHDLALMLIVLGIGSLVDLNLPPNSLEAQHYYMLAKAALALQPLMGEQSVVTIKVLHLMSIYNGMSGKESNLEQSYTLLDFAGQVALRIGFHIDPSMWGIKGREAYERRVYFWNLMAGTLWQSLVTGRPPGLLTSFIDCRIPSAEDENIYQQGEVPLGFGIWGFRASVQCLIPIVKAVLAAKPPSYDTVMELDRKIREVALPKPDNNHDERTAISMRIFVRSHYQDLMLLFLHRGFFAQAMSEASANPQYSQSVFAAYSSACGVIQDTNMQFMKKPLLCARVWRIWSFAFSAAVVVGTVAIRGLHLNFKPPALEEFQSACTIFGKAAETSSRAARAMPILQVMLQKAFQAREHHQQGHRQSVVAEMHPDDELAIFGGQTRLINPNFGSEASPLPVHNRSRPAYSQPPLPQPRPPFQPRNAYQNTRSHVYGPEPALELPRGWEDLYNEVPGPAYGLSSGPPSHLSSVGEEAMLDDRWSSFMQSYNNLESSAGHMPTYNFPP